MNSEPAMILNIQDTTEASAADFVAHVQRAKELADALGITKPQLPKPEEPLRATLHWKLTCIAGIQAANFLNGILVSTTNGREVWAFCPGYIVTEDGGFERISDLTTPAATSKRGRPKGVKNKKAKTKQPVKTKAKVVGKRGRPKGSKNKK